jgi:hypothetical protein
MIHIARATVDAVRAARRPSDLHHWLGEAMRLEHSTIPLYLAAYFSLRPGTNTEVATALRAVVREEMLHFSIAANILTAVGGQPRIDDPAMVPQFPGPLPMGVEAGLVASVKGFSRAQCRVFMQIEQPDDPIGLPPASVATIGDFYAEITAKLEEWGDAAFRSPSAPQVVSRAFPADQMFAVTDVCSAVRAISVIVEQGEGTPTRPTTDSSGTEQAHYYRFGEIVAGKRFVPDPLAEEGWSYSGAAVPVDESAVYPTVDDATLAMYTTRFDPAAGRLAVRFCAAYRRLLTCLQDAFSGSPSRLDAAFGLMYELRVAALAMLQTPDPVDAEHVLTPPWEYLRSPRG